MKFSFFSFRKIGHRFHLFKLKFPVVVHRTGSQANVSLDLTSLLLYSKKNKDRNVNKSQNCTCMTNFKHATIASTEDRTST